MLTRRSVLVTSAAAAFARPARAGDAYAEALARAWGGPIDPRAAHARGWRAARRAQARADLLLRGLGMRDGSVAARLWALTIDPSCLYADDSDGRNQAVADMNGRLAALRPKLAAAFGDLPLPQPQVRRMSRADELKGRGGYREPPDYYVDLRDIRNRPAWTLPSVAFHETVPGHALHAPAGADPAKQKLFSVWSEAWATYAEQLAADLGAYDGDARGELGYLHWRLFRMARIVADTGQGAMGWSPEDAVAIMAELQGHDIAFTSINLDVERMRSQPGVYATQGLGALELARLRPRRVADWPAFHRAILADGPTPCAMLAAVAKGGSRR
jgi:uncharacterized protein (DUF885 family)